MEGMPARAITPSPVDRLAPVARRAGLRDFQSAVQLVSHSNDAWAIGEVILRICWRGDLARLRREAFLLSHLPDAISHPPVLDFGEAEDLTWMVTRRLDGQILFEAWESLEAEHR